MPTYEYRCESCGHKFDALQSMKDEPLTICPQCGGKVKRLIGTGVNLIFKGSGFYITDYKKKESDKSRKKPVIKTDKKDKGGKGESSDKKGTEKTNTTKSE